jgi:transposase
MRTKGSAQELENRRRLAVARVHDGYTQAEVARFLGVHPRTVGRWVAAHRAGGDAGLAPKPHPGPTPRLTPEQERAVLGWFDKDPTEFGFPTSLWTAPRLAQLIARTFGVHYHPRYLNAWLAARRITPQKPERRARERDPERIARWLKHDWPRIKKKRAASVPMSS